MSERLLAALAAYVPRDRVEAIVRDAPLTGDGVAMIADISGFTPLTEALTQGLRPDQGAEELTRALGAVFTPLIEIVHRYGGSVIKFGGDALIVWFGRQKRGWRATVIRRALTAALAMQQAMATHGDVPTPIGPVTLRMKIGLAYGPVQRFNLGVAAIGFEDVLVGATLDRMAANEHRAAPGDVMVDAATLDFVRHDVTVAAWREGVALIDNLQRPSPPSPWPALTWPGETAVLAEKLAAYVPRSIVETLQAGRTQVAELKPVVSLFVQFHGLAYDTDPDIERKLQRYFRTAQRVVARYDGRLNRLITGDKGSLLHVIFGAPRSVEEQERRAARCALDLQRECGRLPFITMQRIGMAAARVFAGPVGSASRHDYTTMGDAVNLSARLMQNAADDQILTETAVRQRLDATFAVTALGQIVVKGKAAPVDVFAVTGVQQQRRQARRLPALFGREDVTAVLQQQVAALSQGTGAAVTLVGDVGMGKTLLLSHLRQQTEAAWRPRADGGVWAGGICLAYGETVSGYLFIDLLRELLHLPPGVSPQQTGRRLADFCEELFGPARRAATYPYLAQFMGLPLPAADAQRVAGVGGESLRWRLFELVPQLVRALTDHFPLVLALDDLQWADPTSVQLIESLLPLTQERPLLLLLAMRPEKHPIFPQAETVEMMLGPLALTDAAALIRHHAPTLPDRFVSMLAEKGAGNPLFLVELVRTLAAGGWLEAGAEPGTMALRSLDLPDSVQGLLLAQMDRLAVEARHTLQMASVIGRTFLDRVLAAIAGAERQLMQRLAELEDREYIQPAAGSELGEAHAFRHSLIQESAYSTLLYERRREMHRRVAQAMEALFPQAIAEQAAFLAHHYERAEDVSNAIYYLNQTADQARLLYAHAEAEALYRRILDLAGRQAEANGRLRANTFLKLAQVHANQFDFATAQEFYERAFRLLEQERPEAEDVGKNGRVLKWGVIEPYAQSFDPGTVEEIETTQLIANLFEGLVELDNEWNVVPAAARRWQVLDDGHRYRFELRPGLRWSDGSALTAHDFVFAWRRNLHPETGATFVNQLYPVVGAEAYHQGVEDAPESIGIRALDDNTLEIRLHAPAMRFLYVLADSVTFPQPAHVVAQHGAAWAEPQNLVSNGAFMVDADAWGRRPRLVRNPYYRGFATGDLQGVAIQFTHPSLSGFERGEIDWCRVDDQRGLFAKFPKEALLVQDLMTFVLGFACQVVPFDDVRARKALVTAVDREALVAQVWHGMQKPAGGGVVPPGMSGHSPEINLPYDPAAARRFWAQRRGGETAVDALTLGALPGFAGVPEFLQASWREVLGIDVSIRKDLAADALMAGLADGTIQMALLGLSVGYPDPDDILRTLAHSQSSSNFFGWQNAEFDRLVEEAAVMADHQQRLSYYHEADRLLVAEGAAIVPLYYLQAFGLLRQDFRLTDVGKILRSTIKFKNISSV